MMVVNKIQNFKVEARGISEEVFIIELSKIIKGNEHFSSFENSLLEMFG